MTEEARATRLRAEGEPAGSNPKETCSDGEAIPLGLDRYPTEDLTGDQELRAARVVAMAENFILSFGPGKETANENNLDGTRCCIYIEVVVMPS